MEIAARYAVSRLIKQPRYILFAHHFNQLINHSNWNKPIRTQLDSVAPTCLYMQGDVATQKLFTLLVPLITTPSLICKPSKITPFTNNYCKHTEIMCT
jgi:hypothetical protein